MRSLNLEQSVLMNLKMQYVLSSFNYLLKYYIHIKYNFNCYFKFSSPQKKVVFLNNLIKINVNNLTFGTQETKKMCRNMQVNTVNRLRIKTVY